MPLLAATYAPLCLDGLLKTFELLWYYASTLLRTSISSAFSSSTWRCSASLRLSLILRGIATPYERPSESAAETRAVQCSAVQCSAVQCSAAQCSAVQMCLGIYG